MRTPLLVVTGIDRAAMDSAMLSLLWDLPGAVGVRHTIDPEAQTLTRVVSDLDGVRESVQIDLEHACIGCAIREDIVPTLVRLAREGRWTTIVATLPVGAEADNLSRVLTRDPGIVRRIRLAGVVAALGSAEVTSDLLGSDLLHERGLHSSPDDERGVGETACALVEYADVVVVPSESSADARDLLDALRRPDAQLVVGSEHLDAASLAAGRHQSSAAAAWRNPMAGPALPALPLGSRAWRLDLTSPRPFHPGRLVDQIERLGGGDHRSRGSFWVPTRPTVAGLWDGSGGQLSIGQHREWGATPPATRIVFTGIGAPPSDLEVAFADLLVATQETGSTDIALSAHEDGLEPWLGEIHRAA